MQLDKPGLCNAAILCASFSAIRDNGVDGTLLTARNCTAMIGREHPIISGTLHQEGDAMPTISKAKKVAHLLSRQFLADGSFKLATGQIGAGMVPAASKRDSLIYEEIHGIHGIAVQAVGYEVGTDEPAVVIYALRNPGEITSRFQDGIAR